MRAGLCGPKLNGDRVKYVVPQPKSWTKNPLDAWDAYNLVGVPLLLLTFMALYLIALKATGKLVRKEETEAGETLKLKHGNLFIYMGGYVIVATLATFAFGWDETSGAPPMALATQSLLVFCLV